MQHEIGNRTYIVAQVEPLDVDGVRTTEVGTALWLLGFHLTALKAGSRTYPADELVADATAAGLRVVHRFGSYELHEPNDDYAVWVLARA